MVAAISMQWLGIAVTAIVVVVLLSVVLLRNRREDERLMGSAPSASAGAPGAPAPPGGRSFLDQPLTHGFEGLGKPVMATAATTPGVATPLAEPESIDPFAPHDDLFPQAPAPATDTYAAPEPATAAAPPAPAVLVAPPVDARPPTSPAAPSPAPTAGAPLSEIIVTSSREEVDLNDPEVRAMLAGLMEDEIQLARVQSEAGDTLDAILQLTEAEKIAAALAADDKIADIRTLLARLQR